MLAKNWLKTCLLFATCFYIASTCQLEPNLGLNMAILGPNMGLRRGQLGSFVGFILRTADMHSVPLFTMYYCHPAFASRPQVASSWLSNACILSHAHIMPVKTSSGASTRPSWAPTWAVLGPQDGSKMAPAWLLSSDLT